VPKRKRRSVPRKMLRRELAKKLKSVSQQRKQQLRWRPNDSRQNVLQQKRKLTKKQRKRPVSSKRGRKNSLNATQRIKQRIKIDVVGFVITT